MSRTTSSPRAAKPPRRTRGAPPAPVTRPQPLAAGAVRAGSKAAKLIALLMRTAGASLAELQAATGWQAHSVRGFLAGTVKRKRGLALIAAVAEDGTRRYRIGAAAGPPTARAGAAKAVRRSHRKAAGTAT